MLVDFNYPFVNDINAAHGLVANTTTGRSYSVGSSYEQSIIFDFVQTFTYKELRIIDITVDMKCTSNSTSTGNYYMSIFYTYNNIKYYGSKTDITAYNVSCISSDTENSIYTMRVKFRLFNINYNSSNPNYSITGLKFHAYYGYNEITLDGNSYMIPTIVSVDKFRMSKDLSVTPLSITDEYKTGIYPYIKIGNRAPSEIRLPVSVKVNKDNTILNSLSVMENLNGMALDFTKSAIVENVLKSNINEEFKLYSFTAFDSELTIDFPIPDYYDIKPVIKVFCPATQSITFGGENVDWLRQAITAIPRYDGKSLKLDLVLDEGSTYYVLVVTGPKSYFDNTSRNYPGSLYIYHDETAEYKQNLWSSYGISTTNSIQVEAGKTYSFLDYYGDYNTPSSYILYYKFIPTVSGVYDITLSNMYSHYSNGGSSSYNQMRLYMYDSNGQQKTYWGYFYNDTVIKGSSYSSYLTLTAGTTYYFAIYYRYSGYYSHNTDFKIDLATRGTEKNNAINIGPFDLDRSYTIQTNDEKYGSLYYDYGTTLYFKFYMYKGILYRFISLSDQNRTLNIKISSEDGSISQNIVSSSSSFNYNYECANSGYYIMEIKNTSTTYTDTNDGYCRFLVRAKLEGDSIELGRSMSTAISLGNPIAGLSTFETVAASGGLYYAYRDGEYPLWFSIDCENGDNYFIQSIAYNGDNYIRIYNESGTQIAYNDDYGGSTNFGAGFTASYTGKYYFKIGYYSSSRTTPDGYCTFTIKRTDN